MRTGNLLSTCAALAVLMIVMTSATNAQEYKMTTPISPGVAVPNKVDTSIGTLHLHDGYPDAETAKKIYDNLDQSRALQAYLLAIPIVKQAGMRDSIHHFGPDNQTDVIWEHLVDSKTVELTANDNGSPEPGVEAVKKDLKIYLEDAANPPAMKFANASGKPSNFVAPGDYAFWELLNKVTRNCSSYLQTSSEVQ